MASWTSFMTSCPFRSALDHQVKWFTPAIRIRKSRTSASLTSHDEFEVILLQMGNMQAIAQANQGVRQIFWQGPCQKPPKG